MIITLKCFSGGLPRGRKTLAAGKNNGKKGKIKRKWK
jgi:hypothetical protein